ncbi:ABC transporter permease [Actinacidiphila sp. ITFR-21]|uniref:ABC transporter permease n=1 Tax=Actinacidiphila sp. ITFR-21 TaxID=3075199 RepID=UPI002889FE0D|nr:ABC transporter permease [Streptomyces sp. ITFR-21]WNI16465.1 ABC transporter permease [Streptomyces sp. ITFR-21]
MSATTADKAQPAAGSVTGPPAPVRSALRRRRLRKARGLGVSALYLIAALVAGLVIWQLVIEIYHPEQYIIPAPKDVWHAFTSLVWADPSAPGGLWEALGATMEATALGFAIGGGAGIVLGIAAGEFRIVQRLLYPYLVAVQSLPKVALVPLLATWFGFGLTAKTSLVVLFVFFPVLVNTLQGVVTADQDRIDLVRSLSGSRWQQLTRVRLFSALPGIFTGLELGVTYAFLGAVLAEMSGSQKGVGVLISQYQNNSDTQATFATLIILAVVGFLLNAIVRFAHYRVVFWESVSGKDFRATNAGG